MVLTRLAPVCHRRLGREFLPALVLICEAVAVKNAVTIITIRLYPINVLRVSGKYNHSEYIVHYFSKFAF